MVIGVVKEIKNREFRVGLTPGAVSSFTRAGHRVLVERGAGRRRRPAPGCCGFVLQRDAGGVRDGAFHIGSMDGHGLFPLLQWVPPRGFPYLYCISIRGGRKEGDEKAIIVNCNKGRCEDLATLNKAR